MTQIDLLHYVCTFMQGRRQVCKSGGG